MGNSDVFSLQHSGLNEFLFAPVGTEPNGTSSQPALRIRAPGCRSLGRGGAPCQTAKARRDRQSGDDHRRDAEERLVSSGRDDDRHTTGRPPAIQGNAQCAVQCRARTGREGSAEPAIDLGRDRGGGRRAAPGVLDGVPDTGWHGRIVWRRRLEFHAHHQHGAGSGRRRQSAAVDARGRLSGRL